MTAARDFEDLRYALEHFSPQQARRLRLIISQDEELAEALPDREAAGDEEGDLLPESFLALCGSIEAPTDYAENHDEYIRERTERKRSAAE
ncbi:hypothetical protein [Streptomyces dysideae]|uniref:Uncharacterized protein n=1 Tax=Streptomyces dysideae TaxID=909626 RepID=A0A117RZV9_9ACTN|nr:hypothetical protein [Streptomyces dysideae]KUO18740.1 hypothetical protein AQJ91_22950 [Streptomyces dysideae]